MEKSGRRAIVTVAHLSWGATRVFKTRDKRAKAKRKRRASWIRYVKKDDDDIHQQVCRGGRDVLFKTEIPTQDTIKRPPLAAGNNPTRDSIRFCIQRHRRIQQLCIHSRRRKKGGIEDCGQTLLDRGRVVDMRPSLWHACDIHSHEECLEHGFGQPRTEAANPAHQGIETSVPSRL